MEVQRAWFEELIFRGAAARRFTQDSPVLPDVWLAFAKAYPGSGAPQPVDLLLTPHRDAAAPELAQALRTRLRDERETSGWNRAHPGGTQDPDVAYHLSSVVARLQFTELVRVVMPLSAWWQHAIGDSPGHLFQGPARKRLETELRRVAPDRQDHERPTPPAGKGDVRISADLVWTIRVVGSILLARDEKEPGSREKFAALTYRYEALIDAFAKLVAGLPKTQGHRPLLWTVSRNREVKLAISRSTLAVKADAAQRLFEIDTRNLAWAILDTGSMLCIPRSAAARVPASLKTVRPRRPRALSPTPASSPRTTSQTSGAC